MIRLGEIQELKIVRKVDFGVYLGDPDESTTERKQPGRGQGRDEQPQRVLLPRKEVPEESAIGDIIEVFVYKDSKDRLISTTRRPLVTLYHTALLRVKEVSRIGAFLDWGLEKDLLLPFHEQTRRVKDGEECLAALYIDKSQRLCATMNVYQFLKKHSPYQVGDEVEGRIYETSGNFGVFVAVDDQYSALIPRREAVGHFEIGEVIHARVTDVKEDGKLDLSVRKKAYLQIDEDAQLVLKVIDEYDGVLPFGEKVSPEIIAREFSLTKNAFKRAVGRLLKEGKIELEENRIYRKSE